MIPEKLHHISPTIPYVRVKCLSALKHGFEFIAYGNAQRLLYFGEIWLRICHIWLNVVFP